MQVGGIKIFRQQSVPDQFLLILKDWGEGMPLWVHGIIFGVTGVLIYLGIFWAVPRCIHKGKPLLHTFFGFLWAPVLLLFPLALYLYVTVEGGVFTFDSIVERFRFNPIQGTDWLWIVAAVLVTVIADQALEPVGKYFARKKLLAPPEYLPAPFNPLKKMTFPPQEFFGVVLKGNYRLLFLFIPLHLMAMFSEEFMWRGYLLPLQETILGSWAWVFNGLLWAWAVHAVLKWHFIGMVPGMLIAPLIAQYTQSTWASLIVHAVPNSLLWILLLLGVLGVKSKGSESSAVD